MNLDNLENLDDQIGGEINLDALVEPEGSIDIPNETVNLDNPEEPPVSNYGEMGLPNLDEEMDKAIAAENGDVDTAMDNPEDINHPEEEFIDDVSQLEGSGVLDDPELHLLKEALSNGITAEEYYKQRFAEQKDFSELSDREIMFNHYSEKYGWDENKINDVLDRQETTGMLDIEAEEIRKIGVNQETDRHKQILQRRKELNDQYQQQQEEIRNKEMNNAIQSFEATEDVFGLPISKAEKDEFRGAFKQMLKLDENGVTPLGKMLQSNENLTKVAYLLYKGDKAIKEALFNEKEKAKQSFKNNLDPEPQMNRESSYDDGQIDLEALTRPEGF